MKFLHSVCLMILHVVLSNRITSTFENLDSVCFPSYAVWAWANPQSIDISNLCSIYLNIWCSLSNPFFNIYIYIYTFIYFIIIICQFLRCKPKAMYVSKFTRPPIDQQAIFIYHADIVFFNTFFIFSDLSIRFVPSLNILLIFSLIFSTEPRNMHRILWFLSFKLWFKVKLSSVNYLFEFCCFEICTCLFFPLQQTVQCIRSWKLCICDHIYILKRQWWKMSVSMG